MMVPWSVDFAHYCAWTSQSRPAISCPVDFAAELESRNADSSKSCQQRSRLQHDADDRRRVSAHYIFSAVEPFGQAGEAASAAATGGEKRAGGGGGLAPAIDGERAGGWNTAGCESAD